MLIYTGCGGGVSVLCRFCVGVGEGGGGEGEEENEVVFHKDGQPMKKGKIC